MITKRVKTSSSGKGERSSWRSRLFESNSPVSVANKFNFFGQANIEQPSSAEQPNIDPNMMEIDTEMVAPNTEAPVFPLCQQVVCPEIEMTDYDPTQVTQETQENNQNFREDVEMADASSLFPTEIVDVFAAPKTAPRQQVPATDKPNFKWQDANPTNPDRAPPAKTRVDPPSSFELSIIELIKSKKIYSVSYEKGKLEVNLE
ncbi:uncharacterized protein F4812DRAFT_407915 [Daldinia caldariorum]|uniref:uncharacterized protein n=1 Tax=Daldinia caldariorum TaxID=326644 RepID=UPI0020086A20|nr:uncharacterized protein F4812DRAFT_407915 [Daldinia caldariorum]KAI1472229.1 hypothetical protein F4812DRAFT_407915 [Daldinia caldariorum]